MCVYTCCGVYMCTCCGVCVCALAVVCVCIHLLWCACGAQKQFYGAVSPCVSSGDLFFWDRVSLSIPGYPGTLYVEQAGLEPTEFHWLSPSCCIKVYDTMPGQTDCFSLSNQWLLDLQKTCKNHRLHAYLYIQIMYLYIKTLVYGFKFLLSV